MKAFSISALVLAGIVFASISSLNVASAQERDPHHNDYNRRCVERCQMNFRYCMRSHHGPHELRMCEERKNNCMRQCRNDHHRGPFNFNSPN